MNVFMVVVPAEPVASVIPNCARAGSDGSVAEVVVNPADNVATTVPDPGTNFVRPVQRQSPAVRDIEVALTVVPLVIDVPVVLAVNTCPQLPAFASLAVVVPARPDVDNGVISPLKLEVPVT